jgi:hypothetical protein
MVKNQRLMGWPFKGPPEDLSVLDVVKFGTIDYKLAGLYWLLMEQRASVIVAAGPAWAGKTTMLNALLDFLPPGVEMCFLQGYYEDFREANSRQPEKTYLVAEEISNHMYEYLWGAQVVKAYNLIPKGYAIGTTTHARNIQEVAYILNALGVKPDIIARLGAVITIQVARDKRMEDGYIRFVDTVSTLSISEKGLIAHILASRDRPDEELVYAEEENLQIVLKEKFGIKLDSVTAEIEKRGQLLKELDQKKVSHAELRKAIGEFYRGRG